MSDFNIDKLIKRALKERKWKPLKRGDGSIEDITIEDITGWNQ